MDHEIRKAETVQNSAQYMWAESYTVLSISWLFQMDMLNHRFTDHLRFPNGIPI